VDFVTARWKLICYAAMSGSSGGGLAAPLSEREVKRKDGFLRTTLFRVGPIGASALALVALIAAMVSHAHTGATPPPPIWLHE